MLRGSYDNTKMDIINAMPEVEEEEEEHNELMRESNSKRNYLVEIFKNA